MNAPHRLPVLGIGLAIVMGLGPGSPDIRGQTVPPPNPNQISRRKIGEDGGGGSASVNVTPGTPAAAARTVVIQYTAVSPMRQWTNVEGKTMIARLLAFAAPAEGEAGPVEVIREGKVRFLLDRGTDPIDYPLIQLSQPDQIDIKAIAQAARRGSPAESEKGAKPK